MIDIAPYSTTTRVLALCRYGGVTPRMFEVLLRHFDNLEDILLADSEAILGIDGISAAVAETVASSLERLSEAERFETSIRQREIGLLTRFDDDYPRLLFELHDPPPLLYVRGKLPDQSKKTVLMVGAENATQDGMEMTARLAREFARADVQIVSSLVGGIDSAAHLACKAAGGVSFAVVDSGFDHVPEKAGMPVAIDIVQQGGVVSEYAPDTESTQETVGEASRLLVGLAQAVVVTEVHEASGRALDVLAYCREVGKLAFLMADPELGPHADEKSLALALDYGVILIEGYSSIDDIIRSLV